MLTVGKKEIIDEVIKQRVKVNKKIYLKSIRDLILLYYFLFRN
jgi:hypothetical protein